MFEYEGPLDLTEYYVRKTELRVESGIVVRVKVPRCSVHISKNNQ